MSQQKITGQFSQTKITEVKTPMGTFYNETETQPAKQQEPAKPQPAQKEKKYLKHFGSRK